MFKSCDYCRHRKKKCVVPAANARCSDCEHLDLPYEFSHRLPSLRRREKSKKIAAHIGIAAPRLSKPGDGPGGGNSGIDEANLKGGDCQLRLAGRRDMADKRLFQPSDSSADYGGGHISLRERYWRDVHPFWPFVPAETWGEGQASMDPVFRGSVELACRLSFKSMLEWENACLLADPVSSTLGGGQLSVLTITGTLLLCPFVDFDDGLIQKIFDTVEHGLGSATGPIPLPVLSGAFLTNVWRRLAGHSHTPLRLPPRTLQSHAQTLDPATFGHHYVRLSWLAAEFDRRCAELEEDGLQLDTPQAWARLEYECLLWQVCLPPSLLDTRDELPATPESVVIHCFSSLLLLSLYSYVLERADMLGTLLALRPVPGVLLFLCTLARSTFICPHKLLGRMPILVCIQAQTARIMLRLLQQTGFENCRGILNLWEDPGGMFAELAWRVREEIGSGPWSVEEIDGYSVFWMFRDLRTLTTKFIFAARP